MKKFDSFFKYTTESLHVSFETLVSDDIFCGRQLPCNPLRDIEGDKDYGTPDKKQYVFSTMENPTYVMYSNGFASEIRYKPELLRQRCLIDFLTGSKDDLGRGIFIVEYFTYYRSCSAEKEFTRTIVERFNTLNFTCERTNGDRIASALYNIGHMTKGALYNNAMVTFRIITYIPEKIVYEKRRIYHPDSGLLVGFGPISERTQHPCNDSFTEEFKKLYCDGQNFVEIEVIDNHSNEEYWIKIGNNLFKLDPTRNTDRAEAGHIDFHVNNATIAKYKSTSLDDLQTLGIYKSKQEAEAEGNLEFKLKILEMENKQQAIENERIRLEQEVKKLQNDKERLEVEKAKLSLDRYKINIDYKITEQKYKYELSKMVLEIKHVKDKLTLFKYGAVLDLMKKKFDMEYNIKIKDDKFNYSTENSFENISNTQNIITSALKTTKLLMDFV